MLWDTEVIFNKQRPQVWPNVTGFHYFAWYVGFLVLIITACQPQPNQIFIEVDGRREALNTEVTTVRDALQETHVILEPFDKVSPDLYVQLEPGMVIVVTRVTEKTEVKREVIPFERQTVVNEALNPGETRLAQLGVNGEDEITTGITYENGEEVNRQEVSRVAVIEPVPEILVIGPQGELPSTTFTGTIAYLSHGNAWLMRDNTGSRRALTTAGDLDGRVFALSPDGRHLLYTRKLTAEIELPLNELWLASTTIVGEKPITLGVQGVLEAEWSPVITSAVIAYSTAERAASPPGWRANNDLWLLRVSPELDKPALKPRQVLPANTQGLYPWWGTTFTWSPNGGQLAYARADQIGVIDLTLTTTVTLSNSLTSLIDFTPLETFSEWVWLPHLAWSPEGKFIAATLHGPSLAAEPAAESQVFDLWLLSVDGTVKVKVVDQVGMWANPAWGEIGIVFGQAETPLHSVNSRYTIELIDRDGSNQRRLFPFRNETGVQLPEIIWSPMSDQILFVYQGDLYITNRAGSPPRQLTSEAQASQPHWVAPPPTLTAQIPLTTSDILTATLTITNTPAITTTAIPAPPNP